MYYRDAKTVHFTWATFLGFLRMSVYVILGVCFLLPGCQEYDTTVTHSKVLVLFDVSGSMDATDGTDSEGGVTRQEKIIRFLTTPYSQGGQTKPFVEHLQDNSTVACYRFGATSYRGHPDRNGIGGPPMSLIKHRPAADATIRPARKPRIIAASIRI